MPLSADAAETLALQVLAWVIGNDELLPVFLGASGASEDDLRSRASDPVFLASVLDFITMNDDWIIAFCEASGVGYDQPMLARAVLAGPAATHWT
jgi:hypothetical protein